MRLWAVMVTSVPSRRTLAFPYLNPLLHWAGQGHHLGLATAAAGLGLLTLVALGRTFGPSLRRRWLALAALLTLLVVSTAVDVAFTEGNGAVMEALNRRSAAGFWGTAAGLVVLYGLSLPIQYLTTYGQQRWALAWRRARTNDLAAAYLQQHTYYRLQAEPSQQHIDNPDQRIADDVQRAVVSATALFFGFFTSLLALGAYILVLFNISGYLVLTLAVASLAGNGVIGGLVRRLAALGFRQQGLEADYRFALMHVRSHAESLAFLRGENPVAAELGRRFTNLLANQERLIRWRSLVEQSTALYAFLMQFAPYLVLSAAYFGGRVSLGDLTVGSIAFGQVQASLSFLIDRADDVSSLFASLQRVGELEEALPGSLTMAKEPAMADLPAAGLRLSNISVGHPAGGRPLVEGLNLTLAPGERLLITGPSGCGKTSLLRVLCGLAAAAQGQRQCPPPEQTLVLPQQPFLPLGSLRDQVLFPGPAPGEAIPSDGALRALMGAVGLQDLADRPGKLAQQADWNRVLSGGEQQRIGFARLLLRRPVLAVLDEASSALDLAAEAELYGLVVAAGAMVVSVGHRPSLRAFHHWELQLSGHGSWRLEPLRPLT
jgi:putative ATP-binding cassette transporter